MLLVVVVVKGWRQKNDIEKAKNGQNNKRACEKTGMRIIIVEQNKSEVGLREWLGEGEDRRGVTRGYLMYTVVVNRDLDFFF